MLIPTNRLIAALNAEFGKLMPLLADTGTDGSGAQAVGHGLQVLKAREERGETWLVQTLDRFGAMLDSVAALAPEGGALVDEARAALARARVQGEAGEIDQAWATLTAAGERLSLALNAMPLTASARAGLVAAVVDWEETALLGQLETGAGEEARDEAITADRLEAYLRDRFDDDTLTLDNFQPLAGGFGKQTIIFACSSPALTGEFVIRRDLGKGVTLTNDCHEIDHEYPVIRALHERGFPAPDAVWLDTEHALLPGGDFLVMRRSPGKLGGSFFGAQSSISEGLAAKLAGIAADLHALPPLTELGDCASFIREELWSLSRGEAARRYIEGWRDYYLAEAHEPSPALAAIYGWLLDNVPDRPGRASLLHGDIGFHNFLFEDGDLSAVLDWEFTHIGDPAEELGYIRLTTGGALDWDAFMAAYRDAGGDDVDAETLRFFQVWGYARNASASNIVINRFNTGVVGDLKLTVLPHLHYTRFIRGAQALIAGEG